MHPIISQNFRVRRAFTIKIITLSLSNEQNTKQNHGKRSYVQDSVQMGVILMAKRPYKRVEHQIPPRHIHVNSLFISVPPSNPSLKHNIRFFIYASLHMQSRY